MNRSCNNCLNGIPISINDDILCFKNGPVTANFICPKHKFTPNITDLKEKVLKCIDCSNFITSTNKNSSFGYCHLFTVREFDGNTRKACSKFVKAVPILVEAQ